MELLHRVKYVLYLTLYTQIWQVNCDSGLVVFFFQKMVFMEFYEKMLESKQNLANHGGVIEVLSYKLFAVPSKKGPSPQWTEEGCVSVVSFKELSKAHSWTKTDPVVTEIQKWSHGSDAIVLLTKSNYDRAVPFTRNYRAHVLALFMGTGNETALKTKILPHFRGLFTHHGGAGYAEVTQWHHIAGNAPPQAQKNWLFYGPMPKLENATALLSSSNITNFLQKYAYDFDYIRILAADAFFNAGDFLSFNYWTILFNIVFAVYCNAYNYIGST